MKTLAFAATLALMLGAAPALANGDAPVPPEYIAPQWTLVAIDGQPAPARATIELIEPGRIAGQGPCNRWFAGQTGALPDFAVTAIGATRMACPEMEAEAEFFTALKAMTRAEVTGPVTLMLTGPDGRSMEFVRPLN